MRPVALVAFASLTLGACAASSSPADLAPADHPADQANADGLDAQAVVQATWSPSTACGPRGVRIDLTLVEGAACPDDAGSPSGQTLFLDDRVPGEYVFAPGPSCHGAVGTLRFDAQGDGSVAQYVLRTGLVTLAGEVPEGGAQHLRGFLALTLSPGAGGPQPLFIDALFDAAPCAP